MEKCWDIHRPEKRNSIASHWLNCQNSFVDYWTHIVDPALPRTKAKEYANGKHNVPKYRTTVAISKVNSHHDEGYNEYLPKNVNLRCNRCKSHAIADQLFSWFAGRRKVSVNWTHILHKQRYPNHNAHKVDEAKSHMNQ